MCNRLLCHQVHRNTEENREKLREACKTILECLGEDTGREGLLKTPHRMTEALLYLTGGYEKSISGKK